MRLVISTSLSSDSRSRVLAQAAFGQLKELDANCEYLDLATITLPACDGGKCYSDSEVVRIAELVESATGILLAAPIYNYDVGSSAKNLIELTGKAWTEKVVGFLCAAGGMGSYMSMLGIANSLMLDFRTFILPRFVYTTGDAIQGNEIVDLDVQTRIRELVTEFIRVTTALSRD